MTNVDGFDRISFNPEVMRGQACIRGTRVTVSTIVETIASGRTAEELLQHYPYIEPEDIEQALRFAGRNVQNPSK